MRQTIMLVSRVAVPLVLVVMVAACAAPEPRAVDAPVAPATIAPPAASIPPPPPPPEIPKAPTSSCASGTVADTVTGACLTQCGAQPAYPVMQKAPTCTDFTLKSGQSFHDQLTLQLSSGATTRIDCPRMRYRGQDTPVCVTREVGGRVRGACCPPGHTNPLDPECVAEGFTDEMFRTPKIWEWCEANKPLERPCYPCAWPTGAPRQ